MPDPPAASPGAAALQPPALRLALALGWRPERRDGAEPGLRGAEGPRGLSGGSGPGAARRGRGEEERGEAL